MPDPQPAKPSVAPITTKIAVESPDMEIADRVKTSRVDSARKTVEKVVEKVVPKSDKPKVQWTPDSLRKAVIAEDERRMASAKAFGPSARKYIVAPAVRAALVAMGPAADGVDVDSLVKRVCRPVHFAGFMYDKRGIRRSRVLPLDRAIAYSVGAMFTDVEDWLVKAWLENPNIGSVLIAVAAIGSTVESLVSEQRARARESQEKTAEPAQTESVSE